MVLTNLKSFKYKD